jgi:SAM-dependent methyltransferase
VFCERCALLFNRAFDETAISYAAGYENALHFSPHFRAFAEALCRQLIARHDLTGKDIVELGCGDGYLLEVMIQSGVRCATGFDPSMAGKSTPFSATTGVEIVAEAWRPELLDRPFAALLCRHVLEHLPDPLTALRQIRAALRTRDCVLYFEVPNAQWMLERLSVWDVIYEHVTYWTPPSLESLFRRAGFQPLAVTSVYGDQFLTIEAVPAELQPDALPVPASLAGIRGAATDFGAHAAGLLSHWRGWLRDLAQHGKAAVIWGAGSKGIAYANAVGGVTNALTAAVDLNTRKQGLFIPGAGLPIVAPEGLADFAPDIVLISNRLYRSEIEQRLAALGIRAEILEIAGDCS